MCMSIGWNPFYNNKEKTAEPWILHEFSKVHPKSGFGLNALTSALELPISVCIKQSMELSAMRGSCRMMCMVFDYRYAFGFILATTSG